MTTPIEDIDHSIKGLFFLIFKVKVNAFSLVEAIVLGRFNWFKLFFGTNHKSSKVKKETKQVKKNENIGKRQ